MRMQLASARGVSELARVELDVEQLEEAWKRGEEVSLAKFWRDRAPALRGALQDVDAVRLAALIKAEVRRRFKRGQPARISEYLEEFPEIRPFQNRVVSLVYEEFCLRNERGETVDLESFCAGYPDWKDVLTPQLLYHRLFSKVVGLVPAVPPFPEVGDYFQEFRLLSVIGRGGSSCVYLASDQSLGGKRVVLKISPDQGKEPETQGALDHPHIVPVHSVVYDLDSGLRGLTMPYRPGLPLDEIARRLAAKGIPSRASALWYALAEGLVEGRTPLSDPQRSLLDRPGPSGDGWRDFPLTGTLSQGAAWIGAILARTLHYAHEMETFHRDVKPGNVLLTLQHGPQLLDFNLAESPHGAQSARSAVLGGTLPYMAPEQIEAFLDPEKWENVGAQADLYSLGLVLRELLTGMAPDLPDEKLPSTRAMRELLDRRVCMVTDVGITNPKVPFALRSIVARCLEFDPADRYPDARALADDLERFLDRRPLVTAVNPSRRERVVNWGIRNRRDLVSGTMVALLLCALAYPWMASLTKPDPAGHASMRLAVIALKSGRPHEAIALLRELVREYPNHPLPWTYLGLAEAISSATSLIENGAHSNLSRGLELPLAESVLLDWGREHPEVVYQIDSYIDRQLDYLKWLKSVNHEVTDQDRAVERSFHETWLRLINLGLKIDPQAGPLLRKLPEIYEHFHDYELAHERLEELIEPLKGKDLGQDGLELLGLTVQRDRVAVKWARSLVGGADPAGRKRAMELMEKTSKDVEVLEPFVLSIRMELGAKAGDSRRSEQIYRYLWIATEVSLTLGQLKQEHGLQKEAETAFRRAYSLFHRLVAHGNSYLPGHMLPATLKELEARVLKGIGRKLPTGT